MKILALDSGEARIGVARTDDLGLMAHPVETVASHPRPAALERIAELYRSSRGEMLVIGLPVRQDGTEGTAAEKVRRFASSLEKVLPAGTKIHFHDEYRSTEVAKGQLRAAGRKEKNQRPIIDQAAAVVILQEYLDWHHGASQLLADGELLP